MLSLSLDDRFWLEEVVVGYCIEWTAPFLAEVRISLRYRLTVHKRSKCAAYLCDGSLSCVTFFFEFTVLLFLILSDLQTPFVLYGYPSTVPDAFVAFS